MTTATLTSKGQATIPKEIREKLGLKPGAKLHFNLLLDGTISIRAKTGSLMNLAGILRRPGQRAVSTREMNEAIAKAAAARFKRSTSK